jgi:hypothetical protein
MAGSSVAVPKPVLGEQMTVHIWSTEWYLVDGTEQLWMEGSSWYMEDCAIKIVHGRWRGTSVWTR